ncbi:MAG: hypothetical protein F8N37_16075 [Telmatospirillum sp.]|nr:hypothetical protein [Telmatospirillum sp.]
MPIRFFFPVAALTAALAVISQAPALVVALAVMGAGLAGFRLAERTRPQPVRIRSRRRPGR